MMHIRVIFSAPIGVLAVLYISVTSAPIDLAQSRMPTSVAPCQRSKMEERQSLVRRPVATDVLLG